METNRQWMLQIRVGEAVWTEGEEKELLLSVSEEERKMIFLYGKDGVFCFEVYIDEMEEPLYLEVPEKDKKELELVWRGYRVELWADGTLEDEEWPAGECIGLKFPEITLQKNGLEAEWIREPREEENPSRMIDKISYWAPDLGRHNVGDCMPFSDGERYHLFYLKDRRQHRSKWGKGAHQFAHISTSDLIHWEEHPAAVPITHPWEGSICTGSVLKANEIYYAFYAVRMMDGSSAKVSWATSEDCIHFTKSEKYFTLDAPYETTSVRDPEVFYGKDGYYHMLLTTDWELCEVPQRKGCLAHLMSKDLENWEQKEPFLIPGYTDQPECTDYFEWNGWYYLIFSNYGTAKYRYSKEPFGPWICPAQEMIDGLLYRVPKTAEYHGRRIAAGFLCINTEGNSYAGNLVLRELRQNSDGTLGTCLVKELLPETYGTGAEVMLDRTETGGYQQQILLKAESYAKIHIKKVGENGNYGLLLAAQNGVSYEMRFDPVQKTMGIYPAHSNLYYHPTKRLLTGIDGLENEVVVELIMEKDILDICLNGTRTLICRMDQDWTTKEENSGIEIGCFVKDCKAVFESVL